ncbi:MAG: CaiB/BaiF CoA transferase family protein [Candidatus Binatia bacterium]
MTQRKTGVLSGINVLDFGRAVAGGYCTRLLADMGARVIKVEPPFVGDTIRLLGPFSGESWTMPPSISPIFLHCNAGKESISVNLKESEAIGLIKRLIPQMDVVVENFTPHVMRSYGLAYGDLRQIREDIVMCSISGFGAEGPLADTPATDPVGQAMSGMLSLCGEEDGYPYLAGNAVADSVTATTAAMAIVAALLERFRTGTGQHIDVSMMHTLFAMDCAAAPYYVASRGEHSIPRGGRFHHLACPWGVFKGPQGRYLVVMAAGDIPWERLVRFMGRPDLIDDPEFASMDARMKSREKVHEIIERFLQSFETAEAAHKALSDARILVGMVLDPWEVATHPQTVARNMVRAVPHPFAGPVPTIATATRFSANEITVGRAPFIGEHNREVLHEFLGLSDSELDRLHGCGVLFEDVTVAHLEAAP